MLGSAVLIFFAVLLFVVLGNPEAPLPPVQKPDAQHMFLQHGGAHADDEHCIVCMIKVKSKDRHRI